MEAQPVAIFRAESRYRHPTIAFSPEEHGFYEDVYGKKAMHPNMQFDGQGRIEAKTEEVAELVMTRPLQYL